MTRLLLATICGLLLLPSIAWTAPAKTTAPAAAVAISPMEMQTPLRGVVTLIEEDNLFYISIGNKDGVQNNDELLIVRDGAVIARARVTKVTALDAIGCLLKDSAKVRLVPGDKVLVQSPDKTTASQKLACDHRTPFMEPDESMAEQESLLTLVTIAFTAAYIITN